jgi:hypothetical protein
VLCMGIDGELRVAAAADTQHLISLAIEEAAQTSESKTRSVAAIGNGYVIPDKRSEIRDPSWAVQRRRYPRLNRSTRRR